MKAKSTGPDFLGIGAQKSGTTWLFDNLRTHPDIWFGKKEVHYFDRSSKYPSRGPSETRQWLRARFLKNLVKKVEQNLPRNDEWYKSLFDEGVGKVCGDITPAYSMLDRSDVLKVKKLLPNAKIIFLLRNPIERAWSHFRFDQSSKNESGSNDFSEICEFMDSPKQELRNNYLHTLKTWGSVFPKEQMFVGFYDEIVHSPENFLRRVFDFLDVDAEKFSRWEKIREPVHVSPKKNIPIEVEKYLIDKYQEPIEKLSDMFDGYPKQWLAQIESSAPGPSL